LLRSARNDERASRWEPALMVRLNRIYTRTGDDGTTGLGNGERRPKFDQRVAAYGDVDETNSSIGLARLATAASPNGDLALIDAMLKRIQNDLFDLGADLCVPEPKAIDSQKAARPPLRIAMSQVDQLEAAIDALNADLSPLRSFVLPGGTPAAAALHQARTICRRAERQIVALASIEGETVGAAAIAYINRLSDFLFVAARYANERGAGDILWVPGANQGEKQER
jgi:cob(I)alamin adenosyltransferase